jgi:dipeptidyl aminopeptidase/acylaminoacyl peptidase
MRTESSYCGPQVTERLTKPEKGVSHTPDSWSPDRQRFSFTSFKDNAGTIWVYSLPDKKATVFAEIPGSSAGRSVFSPDGKWIAYQVNDGGATHNFIQAYPSGSRYQLPPDGNDHHPVWSLPDGKELFYVGGANIFGSVSVTTQPTLRFGSPVRAKLGFQVQPGSSVRTYDVHPDGKHLIAVVSAGQAGQAPAQIQVVLNWFEELKQRVPLP